MTKSRSTLTRASDIEAVPAPRCSTCGRSKWYEGGTQKREDEAARRPGKPGWRCPVCELGRTA